MFILKPKILYINITLPESVRFYLVPLGISNSGNIFTPDTYGSERPITLQLSVFVIIP